VGWWANEMLPRQSLSLSPTLYSPGPVEAGMDVKRQWWSRGVTRNEEASRKRVMCGLRVSEVKRVGMNPATQSGGGR
jgi:hypothetical protein